MKMSRMKLPNNRGITLVEVIVASLLMVIGTLVLSTGFIAATQMMSVSAANKNTAQTVAGMMNGGVRNDVNGEGSTLAGFEFTVAGFKFAPNVSKFKFYSQKNESIVFYRLE